MEKTASILIVDDNPDIREYLGEIIKEIGYNPYTASNGMEALSVLSENKFIDLVLLDVIMPEMNGFDVLREIKKNSEYEEIRIIMVTALQQIEDKELAFKLGASDYLEKPFDIRELSARVRTHIGLKEVTEKYIRQKNVLDTILSTIPGIVYLKDDKYRYIHANSRFYEMMGLKPEDIIGKSDSEIFPSEIADERKKSDDLILHLGIKELEFEEDLPSPNERSIHLITRKRPVYDSDGACSGLVGVSLDITEQTALKEAFFEKEILLSAINENIPYELWAVDSEYTYIFQNKVHFSLWGNLLGKKISDMEVPETKKMEMMELTDKVINGDIISEKSIKKGNGNLHINIKELRPIRTDGEIIGCFGTIQEIPLESELENKGKMPDRG